MNEQAVVDSLNAVLEAVPDVRYFRTLQFRFELNEADSTSVTGNPVLKRLLQTLADQPSLWMFNGYMEVVGGESRRTDFQHLAIWLILRATVIGSARAVTDLKVFLEVPEVTFLSVAAISGPTISARHDLGYGISLVPWADIQDSPTKQAMDQRSVESFNWPLAALVKEVRTNKIFVGPDQTERHRKPIDNSDLIDAALCIGLVGPTSPSVLGIWLEPPPSAPMHWGSTALPDLVGANIPSSWSEEDHQKAKELLAAFRSKSDKDRRPIRLSMQRLNLAMRRPNYIDRAIDLGIAMEVIFLRDLKKDERSEMSFRLRLRAARYLGNTADERRKISTAIRDLYQLRSYAVHTGTVPSEWDHQKTGDLLKEGFALTAAALRKILLEGQPNWDAIQFE